MIKKLNKKETLKVESAARRVAFAALLIVRAKEKAQLKVARAAKNLAKKEAKAALKITLKEASVARVIKKNQDRLELFTRYCDFCVETRRIQEVMSGLGVDNDKAVSTLKMLRSMNCIEMTKISGVNFEYKTIKYPTIEEIKERYVVVKSIKERHELSPGGIVYTMESKDLGDKHLEQARLNRINRVAPKFHISGSRHYDTW